MIEACVPVSPRCLGVTRDGRGRVSLELVSLEDTVSNSFRVLKTIRQSSEDFETLLDESEEYHLDAVLNIDLQYLSLPHLSL